MNCKCNAELIKGKAYQNVFCECQIEVPNGWRVCNNCQSGEHQFLKPQIFTLEEIRKEIIDEINESSYQGLVDIWNAVFPDGEKLRYIRYNGFGNYEKVDI